MRKTITLKKPLWEHLEPILERSGLNDLKRLTKATGRRRGEISRLNDSGLFTTKYILGIVLGACKDVTSEERKTAYELLATAKKKYRDACRKDPANTLDRHYRSIITNLKYLDKKYLIKVWKAVNEELKECE